MADKNVKITEPTANDVSIIQVRRDTQGTVTLLMGSVTMGTDDGSTHHDGGFQFDAKTLPAAAQEAVDTLVAECLVQFKDEHGFG